MIWIVTDTAQEFKSAPDQGLIVMDLPLLVNGEVKEGIEGEAFYQLMDDEKTVMTTSQATPHQFETVFEKLTENGDQVVCLPLSSTLSGTWNSARLASMENENVFLVDTLEACLSQSALVKRAMQLRDQGLSASEIAGAIEQEKGECELLAALATLNNLKKTGRISPAAARVGDLVGVKPIITIDEEGAVGVAGKSRGVKKALKSTVRLVEDLTLDPERPFIIGYSGLDDSNARQLAKELEEATGIVYTDKFYPLSSVLALNAGPDAAGIGFFRRPEKQK